MKRKNIKVGEHYIAARGNDWQRYTWNNWRVVVVDADEWYDRTAGFSYASRESLTFTLQDGTEVTSNRARRKTRSTDKATHVWIRKVYEDGSLGDPELMPLTRIKQDWATYAADLAVREDSAAKARREREERTAVLLKEASKAKERISQTQSAATKAYLPNWVFQQASAKPGSTVIYAAEGEISIAALEAALAQAYEDGLEAGYAQGAEG